MTRQQRKGSRFGTVMTPVLSILLSVYHALTSSPLPPFLQSDEQEGGKDEPCPSPFLSLPGSLTLPLRRNFALTLRVTTLLQVTVLGLWGPAASIS